MNTGTLVWDLLDHPVGYIAHDWMENGVRAIVMCGPSSWNCYLGVPLTHPLSGIGYDDLPVQCHGGLTFSGEGDGRLRPVGFWWYGYDYGHCDDCSAYTHELSGVVKCMGGKHWTADEVKRDSWGSIYDMSKLVRLSEYISNKVKNA